MEVRKVMFSFVSVLDNDILLSKKNYETHIKKRHPEINISIINNIIRDPDYIYKPSRNSLDKYYEKFIDGKYKRVVIKRFIKNKKKSGRKKVSEAVVTAYTVYRDNEYCFKRTYCIFEKEGAVFGRECS